LFDPEAFLRPDPQLFARRAQPRSRLAAGQPPKAARSGLDGSEHGASIARVGTQGMREATT